VVVAPVQFLADHLETLYDVDVGGRDQALEAGFETFVRIDSPTLSRRHARIIVDGIDATLEDLGSKNGTQINGHTIAVPTRLSDGDEIGVGTARIRFRVTSQTSPTETLPTDDM